MAPNAEISSESASGNKSEEMKDTSDDKISTAPNDNKPTDTPSDHEDKSAQSPNPTKVKDKPKSKKPTEKPSDSSSPNDDEPVDELRRSLSYDVTTFDDNGEFVDRAEVEEKRKLYGFCLTCEQDPVQIYYRPKFSVDWKPRSVPGKAEGGKCLLCEQKRERGKDLDKKFGKKCPTCPQDNRVLTHIYVKGEVEPRTVSGVVQNGMCLRCHKVKFCIFCPPEKPCKTHYWVGSKWKPLTVPGKVLNGKCLRCSLLYSDTTTQPQRRGGRSVEGDAENVDNTAIFIKVKEDMASNLDDINIQQNCIEFLRDVSNEEEMIYQIILSGVTKEVIQSMKRHQKYPTIQKLGSALIQNLASSESYRVLRHQFDEVCPSVCPLIVKAIRQEKPDSDVLKMALDTAEVLSENEVGRMELRQENVVEAVSNVMSHFVHNPDIQSVGISVLLNMSFNTRTLVVSEVSEEQMKAVVGAMEKHPSDVKIQKQALDALQKFLRIESNRQEMLKVTNLNTVVKRAHEKYLKDMGKMEEMADMAEMILVTLDSMRYQ